MSAAQIKWCEWFFKHSRIRHSPFIYLHIGDCVGADKQFFEIAKKHEPRCITIGHIPTEDTFRAFLLYDSVKSAKPYLVRNEDIVDQSNILVAAPHQQTEVNRSGTWATIRYARKFKVPTVIVFPDGTSQITAGLDL
jgi:hypothetical protein